MVFGSRYPSVTLERSMTSLPPSYSPVIDRAWRFVDAVGHEHSGVSLRATLTEVTEERYDPDDGEVWDAHVAWVCSLCGEEITPGTRLPDPWGEVVRGPLMATVVDARSDGLLWESTYVMPDSFRPTADQTPEDIAAAVAAQGILRGERHVGWA